jgi:hypothetical protein
MPPPLLNLFLPALLALASAAAPPPDIARLVEQLGSPRFEEREAADKALEKIGEPALEALRGTARSSDAEVRRRAVELVKAIEVRTKGTVGVVATWADLLRQPAIDAGDGVRVRLGISATRCPRWSGIFLYALSVGYDDWQAHKTNRDRLGPLWVSIRFGDRLLDAPNKHDTTTLRGKGWHPEQPLLFARTLMIDRPGRYSIAFRTEAGKEVGSAVVTGTEDPSQPFHPWSPLLVKDAEYELVRDRHGRPRTASAVVTGPGQGIGLPFIGGDWSLSDTLGETHLAETLLAVAVLGGTRGTAKLPPPLPDAASGLDLTLDPNTFLLRVEPRRKTETLYTRSGGDFLARWWVNGKPFLPQPGRPMPRKAGSWTYNWVQAVEFRLQVDATGLGARPGDRVELQLLFCPSGWLPVENPQQGGGGNALPVLTNRVAFRIP